jgi:hypothetical protein
MPVIIARAPAAPHKPSVQRSGHGFVGHARATNREIRRVLTVTHAHSEPITRIYVIAGEWTSHLPIFQAGRASRMPERGGTGDIKLQPLES